MRFDPGNAQDCGSRPDQQDAFGFTDPWDSEFVAHGGTVAVVADGMGGMENGSAASRAAVRAFIETYRAKSPAEEIPIALERSIRRANHAVYASANGGGTTLAAVAVCGSALHWISAGDSSVYLYRRGALSLFSKSHVFARSLEEAVAVGDMPVRQALTHPDRECLTSYLGVAEIAEIDRNPAAYRIEAGDRILVASDGLSKVLSHAEIAAAVSGSSQESCERLVRATMAKNRPDQDNVTVLMLTAMDEFEATQDSTRLVVRSAADQSWKKLLPGWMRK